MNTETTYMGLKLKNPIIVASCGLSKSVDSIGRLVDAGAGGIVLKSLFEEQLLAETREIEEYVGPSSHPEALSYIRNYGMQLGPTEYLSLIEDAKKAVSVPLIASLNCISSSSWIEYAKRLENSGADGLELNIAFVNKDPKLDSKGVELRYYSIVEQIRQQVSIPIAIKLGPYFSSLAHLAQGLVLRGVQGLVLFNRFYQVDCDIDKMELVPGSRYSSPDEISLPIRWIALLSAVIQCDLSASTGIHDGAGVIKLVLAGAKTVQVCSTLYQNGLERIGQMLEDVQAWMKEQDIESLDSFRGKLSRLESDQSEMFERLQYIKAMVGIE
ncbi:MAG TPA: dihydroorotate dehydrogenase-like protein [Candidatus Hydrogenedentes bacterium]|nr:dihydroorotate dehydrogenase-like protein [Candidatus Hydrogenedentota bacterium]